MSADLGMLTVSAAPHIRTDESTAKIMWSVNIALAPAALFSVFYFGFLALRTIILSVVVCVFTEYIIQKWQKKVITIADGSAVVTGLLLAMNLPPEVPWYLPIAGGVTAIGLAKHTMGGLGYNIFNPALIGRAVLLASWPTAMTSWTKMTSAVDGVTSATPLAILKMQGFESLLSHFGDSAGLVPWNLYKALILGFRNGSLGETSILLIFLGGVYLIYKGYINWQVPACMIGTVGILTFLFGGYGIYGTVVHLLSGGLFLGAFFMATDMVTIPLTVKGQIIFAVGAGIITAIIRLAGGYPEGVCYSILIMNSVTPLIDKFIRPARFGGRRVL